MIVKNLFHKYLGQMKKDLNGNSISLRFTKISRGYKIIAISKDPENLFSDYSSDVLKLKGELEELCDKCMVELGHGFHTSFTQPNYSFTSSEIRIIREYSI